LGIFRFLLGVGEGGCFPGATKGALEWFPPEERAVAVGFANGGSAFGAVMAPPVTVWISLRFGWRGAFLATGIMGALWLAAWAGFFKVWSGRKTPTTPDPSLTKEGNQTTPDPSLTKEGDPTTPDPSLTKEGNQTAPRPSLTEEGNQTTPRPSLTKEGNTERVIPWRTLLARREVWGLMGARFLLDPVFYFYMFWIPQYLSQARHIPLATIGNLTWIPFLTLGLANIAGGWISDHLVRSGWTINAARKTMLGLAAALTPVSMLCVAVSGAGLAIALMSVLMFAHGFWIANYMTAIGDLFPTRAVGSVAGISGSAGGVGGILSSLIVGALAQSGFYTPLFVACGVLYPVAFAVILLTVPEIRAIGAELR
jgi:ACS family hexuronate transporter-like MFS transporter